MGCGPDPDQRGNTYLVGVALLVGLTLAGALLILVVGQGMLGDTNQQSEGELAGQVFQQTDEQIRTGNQRSAAVDVPEELQGKMELERGTTWRVRLDGNPKCNSTDVDLGTMQYDGEDKTVGYEGGGVWEMTDGGATMQSPPDLTYDNGSLSLGFPNVSGAVTSSGEIRAKSNLTKAEDVDRNLSTGLYTKYYPDTTNRIYDSDIICKPSEIDQGTLWINDSQYARAWADYFETNYDHRRVEVLSSSHQPGDDVKVRFQLGDVTLPDYRITSFNTSRASSGSPVTVNTTIRNAGGLDGNQEVELCHGTGSPCTGSSTTKSVAIDGGNATRVNFTFSPSSAPNAENVEVSTANDSRSITLEFAPARSYVPDLDARVVDAPQNASRGDDVEVEVEFENEGGMTANQTVQFVVEESVHETHNVTIDPGDADSHEFSLPTGSTGLYNWTIVTQHENESGTFVVGDRPYYIINDTDTTATVAPYDTWELNATLENRGHMRGSMPVTVRVVNVSRDDEVANNTDSGFAINGTAYPGNNTAGIRLTESFAPSEWGEYRYDVVTPNATTNGTLFVGEPEQPVHAITDVNVSENPADLRSSVTFDVTVENVGSNPDTQTVRMTTENGTELWRDSVSLDPDDETTLHKQVDIERPYFEEEFNTLSVSTENVSVDTTLYVNDPETVNSSNGSISVNEEINAEISVLGAEAEGRYDRDIFGGAIQMSLQVENSTGTYDRTLWEDEVNRGDVNDPRAEKTMVASVDPYDGTYDRQNPYHHNVTLEAGSNISVFATSHTCYTYDMEETDVIWGGIEYYPGDHSDVQGRSCGYRGGVDIEISQNSNSENVVILEDGDELPAFGAASSYQRGLDDMLGSRVHDNGTLNLAPGERVFLYELTEGNADPDDATGSGDPDYNDAVALFRVTSLAREPEDPANIVINDTDVPPSVTVGNSADAEFEVANTGDKPGTSNVVFNLQGTPRQNETVSLDPGETRTLTFTVPDDKPPGTHQYYTDVGATPGESRFGSITVGTPDVSMFQITSLDAPSVVEAHETPKVNVTVTNTGSLADRQDVTVSPGGSTEMGLVDGDSDYANLTVNTGGVTNGTVTYDVSTADASSPNRELYVGESRVRIDELLVGVTTYNESTLIERRQLDTFTVKLNNTGTVGGTRDVELTLEDRESGSTWSESSTVEIGSGRITSSGYPKWVTYQVDDPASGDSGLSPGYYDYTVDVSGHGGTPRTWTGQIYVSDDADVDSSQNSSSPISVDSNQVVVG